MATATTIARALDAIRWRELSPSSRSYVRTTPVYTGAGPTSAGYGAAGGSDSMNIEYDHAIATRAT